MKKQILYIFLLLLITCAKEDSQAPNTPPTQIVKQYTLTASAGEGGSVTGGGTFASGTQVSLTATPISGYSFSGWSTGSTANPLTVTLNSNTTITANFQVIVNSYTLTVTAGDGGTVSTEGGEYEEGTEVTITATPDEGYEFISWSDGETNIEKVINIISSLSLYADFGLKYISYDLELGHSQEEEIIKNMSITSNSNVMFNKNGITHLITNPANPRGEFESLLPTIHFTKINNSWEVSDFYDIGMSFGGRDENRINENNDYVFADHGTEVWLGGGEGTPYNNIWVAKNITENNIEWVKVNQHRSFYHDVSSGDLNNDGLYDIVAVHMSTNSENILDKIYYHTFLQNNDGSFTQDYDLMKFYGFQKPSYDCYGNTNFSDISNCTGIIRGSVLIEDITGDGKPEIIGGAYTHNPEWNTPEEVHNSFEIFSDLNGNNEYEKLNFNNRMGWWDYDAIGSDEIKAYDYDNDGDKDLFVGLEGALQSQYTDTATFNGVQIFDNDGEGNFSFSGFEIPFDDLRIARFDLIDVDMDSDLDLVFSAQLFIDLGTTGGVETSYYYNGNNSFFKNLTQNSEDNSWFDTLVDFDELIYYNENGNFYKKDYNNKVLIKKGKASDESIFLGRGIETLNATLIDDELVFYLFKTDLTEGSYDLKLNLIEYIPKTYE